MYYVIEHNIRQDGVVNVSETGRSTFAGALSYFFERGSKVAVSENFVSSHLMLVDEKLEVVRVEHIDGLYVAPKPEPEPEPVPEPESPVEEPSDGTEVAE